MMITLIFRQSDVENQPDQFISPVRSFEEASERVEKLNSGEIDYYGERGTYYFVQYPILTTDKEITSIK
jgi:hypothetical protein